MDLMRLSIPTGIVCGLWICMLGCGKTRICTLSVTSFPHCIAFVSYSKTNIQYTMKLCFEGTQLFLRITADPAVVDGSFAIPRRLHFQRLQKRKIYIPFSQLSHCRNSTCRSSGGLPLSLSPKSATRHLPIQSPIYSHLQSSRLPRSSLRLGTRSQPPATPAWDCLLIIKIC